MGPSITYWNQIIPTLTPGGGTVPQGSRPLTAGAPGSLLLTLQRCSARSPRWSRPVTLASPARGFYAFGSQSVIQTEACLSGTVSTGKLCPKLKTYLQTLEVQVSLNWLRMALLLGCLCLSYLLHTKKTEGQSTIFIPIPRVSP